MNYYIDLFSPETAKAFSKSNQTISGFRISRKTYVENQNIGVGDRFICYCTRIQRFIGVLEIMTSSFIDNTPIFTKDNDPFNLRFKVKTIVWLPLEKGIPIHSDILWDKLSFTKKLSKDSNKWTYMVFSSPRLWPKEDCEIIEEKLLEQSKKLKDYPFTENDEKKLKPAKIRINGKKEISVSVPDDEDEKELKIKQTKTKEQRESIIVQSKLAEIGEKLGFKIWLPRADRTRVLENWQPNPDALLEDLPLVFDETTLKTIRNIDILWIKRRSIVRAFEVEDTTSIYSGILRMADLLSLQPMLDIKIHIVAPESRRDAVFQQITRPVFAVMEKGPLSELCSYISYDSIFELAKEKRLEHMTDTIVDEYSEYSED
ncbi:hypothetical protein [Draconibacterium orientale]|uniref:hypothetical protein n=1 Tax=Draconibacterium orientale TaxID=1168034 RepID=UPI002A0A79D8|nr:hypothetical protein [Draconibacterium orientale]